MQSSTLRQQTAYCDVSEDDDSDLPHGLDSELTSQSISTPENLPANGTSATASAAANGTTRSHHGAKSDTDNDNDDDISLGSSDVEDPEITAMKEEMIRYVNRGPPRQPQASHGYVVPQKPRPAPHPIANAPKQRPPAVTLGSGTTAKPQPKK